MKKPNQNTRQDTNQNKRLFSKADFYEFLNEYNAFKKYKAALGDKDLEETVTTLFRTNLGDEVICSPFSWRRSLEGFDYWSDLNEKWNKRIEKFYATRKI